MDLEYIRRESLVKLKNIGFPINNQLPLLDEFQVEKSLGDSVRRLLCMHAAAACAYGLDKNEARNWLEKENLLNFLTISERDFVEEGSGPVQKFKAGIEGMWALAWSLSYVIDFDFKEECSSEFVRILPNLKISESSGDFSSKARYRNEFEIISACDLSYCLDWAINESSLRGLEVPSKPRPYVVKERRRAFEWLLSRRGWDMVEMDS